MSSTRRPGRPSNPHSMASTRRPARSLRTMMPSTGISALRGMFRTGSVRGVTPADEKWTYNETLRMVAHPVTPDCSCEECLFLCQHYAKDTKNNNQTLVMARQARDDTLSRPWQTNNDDLERRGVETLSEIAALHQKISEAREKRRKAREDFARAEDRRELYGPGPSSFQRCEPPPPPSYPRPTDPSPATEHETIYISSDSDDHVSLITPAPNSRILERD